MTKHATDTATSGSACGSTFPTNGGCGTPSGPSATRPTTIVAAAAIAATHGSDRAAVFTDCSSPGSTARAKVRRINCARAIGLLAALAVAAGCGSVTDQRRLPPAGGPAHAPPLTERPAGRVVQARSPHGHAGTVATVDGGRALAVLSPRERVLAIYDARSRQRTAHAAAGVGPTHVVAGTGSLVYVVDTTGDGLLVFELRPRLRLTRRLPILGRPYGIAADPVRRRLWVTTTASNRLVELAAGSRPHRLRSFPAVRQPDKVAVDPESGRVYVSGRADDVVQLLDPPPQRQR
jgi:hypothetical protein